MIKTKCNQCNEEFEKTGDCCSNMCSDCYKKWLTSCNPNLYNPSTYQYNTGWVCPKCGAVMAPTERSCINCRGYSDWKITWTSNNGSSGTPMFNNTGVTISGEVNKNEC